MSCRPAHNKLSESQRSKRKEYLKNYRKEYWQAHRLEARKHGYKSRLAIKIEGIQRYGGKCACCGETEVKFLTMEHKKGRVKGERRVTGHKAWQQAKQEGWPNIYTVLCFNCNCAKGAFGVCPHSI